MLCKPLLFSKVQKIYELCPDNPKNYWESLQPTFHKYLSGEVWFMAVSIEHESFSGGKVGGMRER